MTHLVDVAGSRLEGFRIGRGRYDRLDGDMLTADRRDQRRHVGRGGDHAHGGERRSGDHDGRCQRQAEPSGPHELYLEATQVLFGTRQCTAFCAPEGAASRQSITMLARA